jgi:hypothetical protein
MPQIVLSDEQARILATALEPVEFLNANGDVIRVIPPIWTKEDIAAAKRRIGSPGPWYTSEQIRGRLAALQEEWDRTGGFDQEYMRAFLKRLNDEDPGQMRPIGKAG